MGGVEAPVAHELVGHGLEYGSCDWALHHRYRAGVDRVGEGGGNRGRGLGSTVRGLRGLRDCSVRGGLGPVVLISRLGDGHEGV